MVDPSRISRRISRIAFTEDSPDDDRGLYFISFFVGKKECWYLSYSVSARSFSLFAGDDRKLEHRSYPKGALCKYLVSILPPEILATCTAASLTHTPGPDVVF